MTHGTIEIDPALANAVLEWAQAQMDGITDVEYGDDWWGAYSPEYEVNVWDDNGSMVVTVYPVLHGETGEYDEYNMSVFCRLGTINDTTRKTVAQEEEGDY